ncbi:CvpA family protein [Campylobacter mucosalis]|uniref:Putative membrane protein, CvpA family n=1 Tax=Campylobacter mucosalis CCUG 21559 TaxID=1032067 RepID=A0A6G5QGW7_9BACT|nr:CvpA family protein [Campylobacter mucosalis]KEA46203.1 colicin V synthesis protein [Campylobacter mucosalis]QCD44746.1 putative membrane protein, CvpA family [Campylobacter mucosalis CCUG 21559]QKF62657.1 CvpA family membrane protein [Campylobacter mucosalis]
MQSIVWFDVIIIGAVLILGLKGLINGLIKEALGLIGLIGGLILASRFSGVAGEFIQSNIYKFENTSLLDFISFIAVWLIFWLFCLLVGKILSKLVGASGLGFLDRLGGFIAGSGKIFLTLSAILAIIANTNLSVKIEPFFQNSKVYPVLLSTGKWIANIDVKALKNDIDSVVNTPKDDKKTDIFIKMDGNLSVEDNATKENR